MKKKILIIGILLLVGVTIFMGQKENQEAIKIGAVMPLTGFGSYWGEPVLKGIALAKEELNIKYPSSKIEIVIADSQSSTPGGLAAANKLIGIDKVSAIYTEFSGVSNAVSPVAEKAGVPLFYSTYNQKIGEVNSNSIKTFVSYEVICDKFAKMQNSTSSRYLIIASIGDAAPYCVKSLKKYVPEENIKLIDGIAGKDFRSILLQNKNWNPTFILPIMYEEGGYALIKQKKELNISGSIVGYKQDVLTEKILSDLPKEYTNGIYYIEVPLDGSFVDKISKKYPGISPDDLQAASNAYQSILVAGQAAIECSDNKDKDCVVKYVENKRDLLGIGYDGAYFENRVLNSDIVFGRIQDGKPVPIK